MCCSGTQAAAGIDVRGDGGYIVCPPSQHISGRAYAISVDHHPDEVPLAAVPEWLLELLHPSATHGRAGARPVSEWRQVVATCVSEGERNQTVASLADTCCATASTPW